MINEVVTKKIDRIKFGVVSPSLIKKIGAVNIITPELYDADGYPVEKGIMDPAMGVIDPGLRCKTCGAGLKRCTGHFGYIQLSKPAINIFYVGYIYDCLKTFCHACGRILLPVNKIKSLKARIDKAKQEANLDALHAIVKKIVSQAKKVRNCPYCAAKHEDVKIDKPTTFYENEKRIWPTEIRERLEKIPDSDLEVLGFDPAVARPEWMVLSLLAVPPITVRPSITLESGERSEDDLTHKISEIVRVNQRLLENINAGAPEVIIEDLWDLLQYHITTFFNNTLSPAQVPPARHKTNRPLKTIAQRLRGKEGRFRSNLAGKRVNFCARSVISPDPYISVDEVGLPLSIAKEVTVPEMVTEWNMKWLKAFVKNGKVYPGANYVVSEEGKRKKITDETKEQILEELVPGWVVERHLINGDITLFNRQPSLHRLSMMAHRVKILPGKSFRLNPIVCTPYNADFDGDEMNLHVPQTEEARSEAENLLLLQKQIVTPRYGLSIIGLEEDPVFGIYMLTHNMLLTKDDASTLMLSTGALRDLPKPVKKDCWDGRQIFSLLLPTDLNFEADDIVIKAGQLVAGTITKRIIGPEGGLLIHHLYKHCGSERAAGLVDQINALGLAVTRQLAYTLSMYDLDLPQGVKKKINFLIRESEVEVDRILGQYRKGKILALPGKSVEETTEAKILHSLNMALDSVGKLIERESKENNNLILLAKSGTSGKLLNLAQMSGFVGQQALRGERIGVGYVDRTLPHFERGDRGPKARGFVKHGFTEGLDPIELFFNAMVGRDSLMDTAMRTPKSGYLQRRLINALQDLKVEYDSTVRDAGRKIVQFSFGGDAIDIAKSDHGGIKIDT